MGYSKGYDKLLLTVGTHRVMHDRLQIVIQHPNGCPRKGSPLDRYKTFHPWTQALTMLDACGVGALEDAQLHRIHVCGEMVDGARR